MYQYVSVCAQLSLEGHKTGGIRLPVAGNWGRSAVNVRKTSLFTVHPPCLCFIHRCFLLPINSKKYSPLPSMVSREGGVA